jgi:hypothetical protein
VVDQSLKECFSNVAPYLKLWSSLKAWGAAINLDGARFNLAIRFEFVEDPSTRVAIHSPEQHFLHHVVDFPRGAAERIVQDLTRGKFDLDISGGAAGAFAQILAKRESPQAAGHQVHRFIGRCRQFGKLVKWEINRGERARTFQ